MKSLIAFFKKETVLSVAWILAVFSAFWIHPSASYVDYIDFRSLGILWGMMVIMAGLKSHGFFRMVGQKLLQKAKDTCTLVLVLVFLCFFFSMLITNDVSLLTFVPFTLSILGSNGKKKLIVPVVVLQTLAANLGSMLTPIGNPQNLYLYGISGMGMGSFLMLMLPYTAATAVLLLICSVLVAVKAEKPEQSVKTGMIGKSGKSGRSGESDKSGKPANSINQGDVQSSESVSIDHRPVLIYGLLFALALLTVLRILPWYILAAVILATVFIMERGILKQADYALLATFIGFFIFTGNMGKVPAVASALNGLVQNHETILGILTSQAISNVPAALLLSGFTQNYPALIIGVNLGGLGTLIASMASLISYKFVATEEPDQKGDYFLKFTIANILYLILLIGLWLIIC